MATIAKNNDENDPTGTTFHGVMCGEAGWEAIDAGRSHDTLMGGLGDDTAGDGVGNHPGVGGKGADVFRFATGEAGTTATTRDMIQGFQRGLDPIDRSLVDANPTLAGDQALILGATAFGARQAPQADDVTVLVMVDTRGDAVAPPGASGHTSVRGPGHGTRPPPFVTPAPSAAPAPPPPPRRASSARRA